jgi:hypothetical protein
MQNRDRGGLNLGWFADVESKKSLKGAWSHAKFGERIHENMSLGGAARALVVNPVGSASKRCRCVD